MPRGLAGFQWHYIIALPLRLAGRAHNMWPICRRGVPRPKAGKRRDAPSAGVAYPQCVGGRGRDIAERSVPAGLDQGAQTRGQFHPKRASPSGAPLAQPGASAGGTGVSPVIGLTGKPPRGHGAPRGCGPRLSFAGPPSRAYALSASSAVQPDSPRLSPPTPRRCAATEKNLFAFLRGVV